MEKDIFICHASEDKNQIVRQLVEAFTEANISCWYDEAEIQWGDSITQKVNEGLSMSRYVMVILSPALIQKNWPQRELNAVLNQEASSGEVRVLPLLVGNEIEKKTILEKFPLLGDKCYLPWDGNIENITCALLSRLGRTMHNMKTHIVDTIPEVKIPLPRIKRPFSQHDKDIFLREGFNEVKSYFKEAFKQLKARSENVECDIIEIHSFKFTATIYTAGDNTICCKIWVGGLTSSDSIAYSSGRFDINNDNSFNDMLFVDFDDQELFFKPSGMWIGLNEFTGKNRLNSKEVAEYLWRRFIEPLNASPRHKSKYLKW